MNRRLLARAASIATSIAVVGVLAGCASQDPLAEAYQNADQNYISGDGTVLEVAESDRDEPVEFTGESETGETISSDDFAGSPYVVNFWFASCPPCQAEADALRELSEEYAAQGVPFLGVNTYDGADVAKTFAAKHDIEYPSILDASTASVQLAFAGVVAPNATPTTLVMDSQGRVAGRISGFLAEPGILAAMIDKVLAEAE